MKHCAYSFLTEESHQCDYEIATDRLASYLGLTMHYLKHVDKKDILFLVETIYHANGSIRGKNAIDENRFKKVEDLLEKYRIEYRNFYLPMGCKGASYLHILRSECKNIVRWIEQIKKEKDVDENISQLFHLLSNLFFVMALYENKMENVEEIVFQSLSYK